jgi:hypothetical protein
MTASLFWKVPFAEIAWRYRPIAMGFSSPPYEVKTLLLWNVPVAIPFTVKITSFFHRRAAQRSG